MCVCVYVCAGARVCVRERRKSETTKESVLALHRLASELAAR